MLFRSIENLEHKSRRLDVLVDEELIASFYDKAIPADIHNAVDFEQWLRKASKEHPRLLYLSREDLMRHEAAGITTENFPAVLLIGPNEFRLEYHFEPGASRDGVTMTVPVELLNQVSAARCDWMVPGLLGDKVDRKSTRLNSSH